jgi:hypothetical protein
MESKKESKKSSWSHLLDKNYNYQRLDEKKLNSLEIKPYKDIWIFSKIFDKTLLFLDEKIGKKFRILLVSLLLFTIIPGIIFFIATYIENTQFLIGNNEGFLEDYVNWTHLIVFGIVFFLIKNFYDKISVFFEKVVYTINKDKYSFDDYKKLIDNSNDKFQLKGNIFYYIFLVVGFFVFILITFYSQINRTYDIWHSFNQPIGISVYAIYNFITLVIILPILIYHFFVIIRVIKKYTKIQSEKNALLIRPHNLDNAFGFGICGEIALSFYWIALVPISFIIVGLLRQTIFTTETELGFAVYVPVYIIGLIIVFIYPIYPVHIIIMETRENELKEIRGIYNENYQKLIKTKKTKNIKNNFEIMEKLEKVSLIYNDFFNIKTWPFNMDTLKGFLGPLFSSIILPIAFILFDTYFM